MEGIARTKKGRFVSAGKKRKYEEQSTRIKLSNERKKEDDRVKCQEDEQKTEIRRNESLTGRRIVELAHLSEQMKCDTCGAVLDLMNTVEEQRFGFGSILNIDCVCCGSLKQVETSKRHRPEGNRRGPQAFDINTKAAIGMYHSGSGHTQITDFLSAIEVPVIHHRALKKREREVERHISVVAEKTCRDALDEEIRMQKEKMGNTSNVNLEMKYDMGWQKRGSGRTYDSKSGVGTMIGNNSGKICSYDVRVKDCKTCSRHRNEGKLPPSHSCSKNWMGSSKSMEADVAVNAILNMEKTENVKVGVLIMDDDTTTMSKLRETVSHPIVKWSDLNHTKKHLGNSLYNLQKTHKCLTSKVIQYLQKCFTYAVNQNKNDSNGLEIALRQIVPHVFGFHEMCNPKWCGYKSQPESYKHKSLPYGKNLNGKQLFEDLNLLFESFIKNVEKIAPAASTKDVESFNNKIASKAPKRHHYSASSSLKNRVNCAVSEKNIGSGYVTKVNTSLGISPGSFYSKHAERKDHVRRRRLVYENTREFKKRKIERKLGNSVKKSQTELREGITYKTGVDLSDHQNVSEIPPPQCQPEKVQISNLENVSQIVCDIETTSLSKSCSIVQISAVCNEDVFSQYIFPTQPIARSASQVTGLEMHGESLFYKDNIVPALPLKESLTLFVSWLQDRKPCFLIGHNFQIFDFPRIIRAFIECNLLMALQESVIGIVDTLPLFKEIYPGFDKYKQEYLVQQILHETYSAHNAEADVCSLQKLLNVSGVQLDMLSKHSTMMVSCVNRYKYAEMSDENLYTLSPMYEQKIISKHMAGKIAKSGLNFAHLKLAVERGGLDGLKKLLSEKINGKVRVTSSKSVIDKLFQNLEDFHAIPQE